MLQKEKYPYRLRKTITGLLFLLCGSIGFFSPRMSYSQHGIPLLLLMEDSLIRAKAFPDGFYRFKRQSRDMFGLDSAHRRLVDNRGAGYPPLDGVRNFRVVLNNTVYRGGGDNRFLRDQEKNAMMNPLPYHGIDNLRKSGFSEAIYLYPSKFDQKYPNEKVDSLASLGFAYSSQPNLTEEMVRNYFGHIMERILYPEKGPIYIHCWNGWHQAGLLSAYTLMQFCGLTNGQALEYWEVCASPHNKGYSRLKTKISTWEPYPEFMITEDQQKRICPCMTEEILNARSISQREKDRLRDEAKRTIYHRVRSGETLSHLAVRYHTSVRAICNANGIRSSTPLQIGQRLKIIKGESAPASDEDYTPQGIAYKEQKASGEKPKTTKPIPKKDDAEKRYHTLKKGDTLWSLSIKYKTTIKELCKLNNIRESTILYPGKKLRIQ
jgi:LysM repeat protein